MQTYEDIWTYLNTSPLTHLTLTLLAYQAGSWIYKKGGMHPLLNPVMIAVIFVVSGLYFTGTSYADYFEGAQFVHFLLGPATVALAIPLYLQYEQVKKSAFAILISIVAGSLTAIITALAIGYLLNGSKITLLSVAPKSVTTPVAMGISEQLGGLPSLTAILVILTGICGAMLGPICLNLIRVTDKPARGLAMGTASHGIGTARAFQVNKTAGAFAGLAIGLNALATAILLPLIWNWFF
jgi:predicted murein hydrolase (TIGR00659 family)